MDDIVGSGKCCTHRNNIQQGLQMIAESFTKSSPNGIQPNEKQCITKYPPTIQTTDDLNMDDIVGSGKSCTHRNNIQQDLQLIADSSIKSSPNGIQPNEKQCITKYPPTIQTTDVENVMTTESKASTGIDLDHSITLNTRGQNKNTNKTTIRSNGSVNKSDFIQSIQVPSVELNDVLETFDKPGKWEIGYGIFIDTRLSYQSIGYESYLRLRWFVDVPIMDRWMNDEGINSVMAVLNQHEVQKEQSRPEYKRSFFFFQLLVYQIHESGACWNKAMGKKSSNLTIVEKWLGRFYLARGVQRYYR
jgi:hypothetical protein